MFYNIFPWTQTRTEWSKIVLFCWWNLMIQFSLRSWVCIIGKPSGTITLDLRLKLSNMSSWNANNLQSLKLIVLHGTRSLRRQSCRVGTWNRLQCQVLQDWSWSRPLGSHRGSSWRLSEQIFLHRIRQTDRTDWSGTPGKVWRIGLGTRTSRGRRCPGQI